MVELKKQTFFKGSLILMASAAIAKVLGAFFKVPLTNLLGGIGMGYFSCAYGLFLPIYALSITGLSSAAAKITAEEAAGGCYANVRRIRNTSRLLFTAIGALLTFIIIIVAEPFTVFTAGDRSALYAVLMIAPSALFGCICAAERGCYEGLRNMYPTAVSQAVEAAVKMVAGLWLAGEVLKREEEILSFMPPGTDIMSLAAAAAVLGVTLSTAAGCLYFVIRNLFGDRVSRREQCCGKKDSRRSIVSRLMKTMLPIAMATAASSLTSIIDLCTVMRSIASSQTRNAAFLAARYGEKVVDDTFPAFVYGAFTGMALTVFNLIPSVTNMFGRSVLPCAARAAASQNKEALKSQVRSVSLAASLIAMPAGAGLFILAEPVMNVLYGSHRDAALIAAEALRALIPGMICLCIVTPLFSVMQGMGRADAPVKLTIPCVLLKLAGNLVLIACPYFTVSGAGLASSLCYGLMFILTLRFFTKELHGSTGTVKALLPVLYGAVMCGGGAWLGLSLSASLGETVSLVCAVAAGFGVYVLVLGILGFTPKNLREKLSLRI